jgi:hypothetical protein
MPKKHNERQKPVAATPEGYPIYGYKIVERDGERTAVQICNSPLRKKPGRFCQIELVVRQTGRCDLHGGNSPVGLANGNSKPGLKYSRYSISKRLAPYLERAQEDPDPVNIVPDIQFIDVRLAELSESLSEENPAVALQNIRKAWGEFEQAYASGNKLDIRSALTRMHTSVNENTGDAAIWNEIVKLQDHRRKLALVAIRKQQVEETSIGVNLLLDMTARLESIFGEAVQGNVAAKLEWLIQELRIKLLETMPSDAVDVIMGAIVPTIRQAYVKTQNAIITDATRDIAALLPAFRDDGPEPIFDSGVAAD